MPVLDNDILETLCYCDQSLSRYLQMSAQARIVNFEAGYPEFLDVTVQDPEFTYEVRMFEVYCVFNVQLTQHTTHTIT